MTRRKHLIAITAALAVGIVVDVLAGDLAVTDVVAKQRYPWNGLVDITCKVSGIDGTTIGGKFTVSAVMPDTGDIRKLSHFWVVQNGVNSTGLEVHANGDYRLLWDARADLGQVSYSNMVVCVTLDQAVSVSHEKVQLWEGGPYWAPTNIGAEEPWEYGYYFWWGDTVGYMRENNAWVATDGSTLNFSFESGNTPNYRMGRAALKFEGWITSGNVLTPEHDAAHVKWGGGWRMPTTQELDDLNSNCDWTWTTMNGVNGCVVRGRGAYASNSIFLPATGTGGRTSLSNTGTNGLYWSSVPDSMTVDCSWAFGVGIYHRLYYCKRAGGASVRPVQGFTE